MALDTSPDTLEKFLELKTGFDVKCPPPKYQLHLSAWQILIEKVNELTIYSVLYCIYKRNTFSLPYMFAT